MTPISLNYKDPNADLFLPSGSVEVFEDSGLWKIQMQEPGKFFQVAVNKTTQNFHWFLSAGIDMIAVMKNTEGSSVQNVK